MNRTLLPKLAASIAGKQANSYANRALNSCTTDWISLWGLSLKSVGTEGSGISVLASRDLSGDSELGPVRCFCTSGHHLPELVDGRQRWNHVPGGTATDASATSGRLSIRARFSISFSSRPRSEQALPDRISSTVVSLSSPAPCVASAERQQTGTRSPHLCLEPMTGWFWWLSRGTTEHPEMPGGPMRRAGFRSY
jgi:hypothetical protein